MATLRASSFRASAELSCVSNRKTGLPPIGFTIGKRALTNQQDALGDFEKHAVEYT